MRLSVGIFAHNEELNIGATLSSLFRQTLLGEAIKEDLGVSTVEILCLANGCRDGTVDVARTFSPVLASHSSYRVIDLPEPGKARTWNAYVHDLSDPAADFLFLMDADIIFDADDVLEQLLRRLVVDVGAQVATDTPLKVFVQDLSKISIADRASLAASEQKSKEGVLCESGRASSYLAAARPSRRGWLPGGHDHDRRLHRARPIEPHRLGAHCPSFLSNAPVGRGIHRT